MRNFWDRIINPRAADYSSDAHYIYRLITFWTAVITILVIIFFLIFLPCNRGNVIVTFLLAAAASFAGGAAIGFLFGLPRAEKYRFLKKEDVDHNSKDYSYGDNTNLEEVSDWLTKIIVGLTLIKLNTLLKWLDQSAHSIDNVFKMACCEPKSSCANFNGYVFGYCTIIFYFLTGAGLCYLWARTNLSLIFTKSKIAQKELENKQLVTELQKIANPGLSPRDGFSAQIEIENLPEEERAKPYPSVAFRNIIEGVYNAKTIFDKTDIQRKRWGGEFKKGDYILEASFLGNGPISGLYGVQLSVRSLNSDNLLKGEVAFFLHDSFPSEIVYTVAINNKAEISFSAYEAFIAGARLENGTELELDLNKVKGFPEAFYWKE
ncbi:MAG: pYEATS domain-containing protein [Bacteroidota bacterium]